jgi:UDP-GlcNAc3NAcA epimerase
MRKIMTIVGVWSQFIKLAPLGKLLDQQFNYIVIYTGQHFDDNMLAIFFPEMGIQQPGINLNIQGGGMARKQAEC